jgi:hypothetical protein
MFCGAAGEALNPAEHPFNNLDALRAQIWTEPNLNDAAQSPAFGHGDRRFNNLDALRAQIWTEPNLLFLFVHNIPPYSTILFHPPNTQACLPIRIAHYIL